MKYAIISDIHGNYPAFNAVLDDVKNQGIDHYIIVGDYCLSGPYPDECITELRSLTNKYIIRGNEERYLENLIGKDQRNWTDGQMQISYWCYRNIQKENLDYLMSLPHTAEIVCNGVQIHIAHSSEQFIGDFEFKKWGPAIIAKEYANKIVTHALLNSEICKSYDGDEEFLTTLSELSEGIYIFGHTHIQWNYKTKDKQLYLINPGSCGLPLDGINDSVPYTVLDISDEGMVRVEERRIPFDKKKYVETLKQTSQYSEARVWSEIIIMEQLTAKEHLTFFLQFVEEYAQKIKDDIRPYNVETWEKAFKEWVVVHFGQ